MKSQVSVTTIVVSYNTKDLTLACLDSVYKNTKIIVPEVVVIDNASSDGSAEAIAAEFPQVRLIASYTNLGFAAGNNLAAREARGEYLLLLNPDTLVLDSAIDNLVQFVESNPKYGIYGGRTLFSDGTLNASSCFRKPTIWNSYCRALGISAMASNSSLLSADVYGGWQRDTVREIDIVTGCFLLMRRELWDRLGGFDPRYFMYGEDWDLCLRAQKLGERNVHCPDAEIIHYGGASEPVRADRMVRLFQTRTLLYASHWGFLRSRLLELSLWVWAFRCLAVDGLLGTMGKVSRKNTANSWWEVLKRHREWSSFTSSIRHRN